MLLMREEITWEDEEVFVKPPQMVFIQRYRDIYPNNNHDYILVAYEGVYNTPTRYATLYGTGHYTNLESYLTNFFLE